MSFFDELKRRNVFRVSIAYLITAWILAQVADLMLENFGAPDWVIKAMLVALIIGFPIAVIFAWAFEMTPEGIKLERDVDRGQSITHKTGRKLDFTIIGILVIAVAFLLFERFNEPAPETSDAIVAETEGQEAAAEEEIRKSIAVLPFVNMSDDASNEYFSDGISEEILNALASIHELKVAGRTSSFAFKGENQDLRIIGEMLGVEHILEGSVRKAGNKVRITAQLIQVDDGFHLWSDTYDRELTDVFAIQDEISNAILIQLKAQLLDGGQAKIVSKATDTEAYDLYLLARQRLYARNRASIEAAAELLDKAIARDSTYAPAYAQRGIAALLLSTRNYGDTALAEAGAQAKLYLDKALELDPNLAEGWAGLGLYYGDKPGEHIEGIQALEKALSINPNLIDASNWLQIAYGENGDNARALEIVEKMVETDPLYPPGFANAVNMYNLFGMQDKSWALLERVRPFVSNNPQVMQVEASIWMSQGKISKALPLLETALAQQPSDAVIKNFLTVGLLQTGQYERLTEEGHRWGKVLGLQVTGRLEESTLLAQELASEGQPGSLIALYDRTDQHTALITFIEDRWADLAAFQSQYPHDGDGYGTMLRIARAYSKAGNEPRFNDAMARVRAAHDSSLEQGIVDPFFMADEARYHVLAGDRERAISLLTQATDRGMVLGTKMVLAWREMEVLSGDDEFEALQTRLTERLNNERAELGLEGVTI